MKLLLSCLLLMAVTTCSWAQTEKPQHKKVADQLERYYNASQYDSIFSLFGNNMKNGLPLDKTKTFFEGLQSRSGKITKRAFTKYASGFAVYKTNFERSLWAIQVATDDQGMITGLYVKTFIDEQLPVVERNITKLQLPFQGEWTVFWGGDTKELNYHVQHPAQKGAFDIVIRNAEGKSYKSHGETNEDYYAFGKELLAPCNGEVVLAVDGIKDNKPGELNPTYVPGNTVIIKTANNEYLFFAHFKQFSIKVKQGQQVTKGQLLGLCGNSGNSSEPHLHFHIQNTEDMNKATGAKCYFDKIMVNGQPKTDYSPIRHDRIRNE